MVNCGCCGKEIEIRYAEGLFTAGCWSAAHDAPNIEDLQVFDDDIWPYCGNPCETEQQAIKSFEEYWV